MRAEKRAVPRTVAMGALVVGLAGGSYGVAAAASGSGTGTTTTTVAPAHVRGSDAPPAGGGPWGRQRSDETPLTGDALAKATAAAKANMPGGTIVRVETDADGKAAYEAHMTDASGARVTVYLDKSFAVVDVETR